MARLTDQPPVDVGSLASEALALLDEQLPPSDKLDNLATVRALLRRIAAIATGIDEALRDTGRPDGWDPEVDVNEHGDS